MAIGLGVLLWISMHEVQRSITPPDDSTVCRNHIRDLSKKVVAYAQEHGGRFPDKGSALRHPGLRWVEEIIEWSPSSKSLLKCPIDNVAEPTSYILNPHLAGGLLKDIPKKDWKRTALLGEKPRNKTHRWVYYLDGHVDRTGPCRPWWTYPDAKML